MRKLTRKEKMQNKSLNIKPTTSVKTSNNDVSPLTEIKNKESSVILKGQIYSPQMANSSTSKAHQRLKKDINSPKKLKIKLQFQKAQNDKEIPNKKIKKDDVNVLSKIQSPDLQNNNHSLSSSSVSENEKSFSSSQQSSMDYIKKGKLNQNNYNQQRQSSLNNNDKASSKGSSVGSQESQSFNIKYYQQTKEKKKNGQKNQKIGKSNQIQDQTKIEDKSTIKVNNKQQKQRGRIPFQQQIRQGSFEAGDTIDRIQGVQMKPENGQIMCLVEWQDSDAGRLRGTMICSEDIKKFAPLKLLDYYEDKVVFQVNQKFDREKAIFGIQQEVNAQEIHTLT